jgi:hypothetical protein
MAARRTVVITGGSSGIGLAAAEALAGAGDEVVLLGRHPARLQRAAERVGRVTGGPAPSYLADFAVLDQVRTVARRIADEHPTIHVLVNNAGLLAPLRQRQRTVDGHDRTMQVNHLAGFLLTQLLLDPLRAGATSAHGPARLITTASAAEVWGWLDVDRPGAPCCATAAGGWRTAPASRPTSCSPPRRPGAGPADGIVATCFFPGLVQTRFARGSLLFWLARPLPVVVTPPAQGADTAGLAGHGGRGVGAGRVLRLPRTVRGQPAIDRSGPGPPPVAGEPDRGRL